VPPLKVISVSIVAVVVALFSATSAAADISRQKLQGMFDQMQRQSHWDRTQPLLWGYFFNNPTREPLDKAAPLLSAMGYRIVGIYLAEKKSMSAPDKWWLHIERIEVHTVDSLDMRNREFNDFATAHGIALYDGMDVGPASGGP
jgi:Regulator of ribonuclease activity B